MVWDALQLSATVVAGAVLYLVYICHLMHKRQERVELYVMTAVRMGTLLAGGAAINPFMTFMQRHAAFASASSQR